MGKGEQNRQEIVTGNSSWEEKGGGQRINRESELKPLPDTPLGGDLILGVSSGVTSGRKSWPKNSGMCQEDLGVSVSRVSVQGGCHRKQAHTCTC